MKFLESISAFIKVVPGFQIAFVGHSDEALLLLLSNRLQGRNGAINAFIYGRAPKVFDPIKLTLIDNYSKNFRTLAREYELLILNDLLMTSIDNDKIVKNCFKALENSGDLLIIEKSKVGIYELLDAHGFVAINEIDTDDKTRVLISAKKMHGWGYGL